MIPWDEETEQHHIDLGIEVHDNPSEQAARRRSKDAVETVNELLAIPGAVIIVEVDTESSGPASRRLVGLT